MRVRLILLLSFVCVAGCSSPHVMNYILTTESPYICCRSIRYSTWPFQRTTSSQIGDTGVVVRLSGDTIDARCERDAPVDVTIANNTEDDIYIPFSKDLDGDRLKLYPWRLIYADNQPMRLARQVQYNDMVERQDALLRFFRLPAGQQTVLHAIVPERWLCAPTTPVTDEYLGYELDPNFYSDRTRSLRASEYHRDPNLLPRVPMAYEIVYTTLRFIEALPQTGRIVSAGGDTTQIRIGIKDEPGTFMNGSQHVARSNTVLLRIAN